jgi:hypothetical protein
VTADFKRCRSGVELWRCDRPLGHRGPCQPAPTLADADVARAIAAELLLIAATEVRK